MNEQDAVHEPQRTPRYLRFAEWLDSKLYPLLGPPDLGPFDDVVTRVREAVCPVCGSPMAEHIIDHSTRNTILTCPSAELPIVSATEVNEFGMRLHHD